jgi:predicted nucleic acid-binding protein
MPDITVVDTSVLIALEKINLLELLCKIYVEIILPEAVAREFGTPTIDCYRVRKVKSPLVKLLATD